GRSRLETFVVTTRTANPSASGSRGRLAERPETQDGPAPPQSICRRYRAKRAYDRARGKPDFPIAEVADRIYAQVMPS
ncbi:hypothetical protein, partial [Streptomyces longispororuber]|uniref:hypothetical protein n=1 Tax=Streptomyces longispororuber TaxID=68230 RepID=UPI0036FFB80A